MELATQLRKGQARLWKQSREFLDDLDLGLLLFDRNGRLIARTAGISKLLPRVYPMCQPNVRASILIKEALRSGDLLRRPARSSETAWRHWVSILFGRGSRVVQRADGRWLELRVQQMEGQQWITSVRDVTTIALHQLQIGHRAAHDPLTGLLNRSELPTLMAHRIRNTDQSSGQLIVALLDLDHFKPVNDQYGHAVGDALLVEIGRRLRDGVRDTDVVARIGGDEFVVLLYERPPFGSPARIIERVRAALCERLEIGDIVLHPSATIGYTVYPADPSDAATLLEHADAALYAAKAAGRGCSAAFAAATPKHTSARPPTFSKALANNEVDIDLQPIVDVLSGELSGCEALIRWNHPERGRLSATDFYEELQQHLESATDRVLALSLDCFNRVRSSFKRSVPIWINVAPQTFLDTTFMDRLIHTLREYDVSPENLVIELTETGFSTDLAVGVIHRLRADGIRIAIDDFGSDNSRLNMLGDFPADIVKIDRSLLADVHENPRSRMILRHTLDLLRELELCAVVEGVENEQHFAVVQKYGCALAQGFFFAKPMGIHRLVEWLR